MTRSYTWKYREPADMLRTSLEKDGKVFEDVVRTVRFSIIVTEGENAAVYENQVNLPEPTDLATFKSVSETDAEDRLAWALVALQAAGDNPDAPAEGSKEWFERDAGRVFDRKFAPEIVPAPFVPKENEE